MKKTGFTLVELVITITILVILSTIAFVSFQSYTKDSRDANRLATLNQLSNGLKLSFSKNGAYPIPESPVSLLASGTIIGYQGTIGNNLFSQIGLQSEAKDPLDKKYYTYRTDTSGEKYQILALLENQDNTLAYSQNVFAGYEKRSLKGLGDSLGILLDTSNTPIQESSLTGVDLITTQSGTSYISYFDQQNIITSSGGQLFSQIYNRSTYFIENKTLANYDSSLVGYWDMESITYSGATKLLQDISQYKNGGTIVGNLEIGTKNGILGKSTGFGTTSNYISIPHNVVLSLSNNFTISAWIFPIGLLPPHSNPVLVKGNSLTQRNYYIATQSSGALQTMSTSSSGSQVWLKDPLLLPANSWTNVVLVKKGTSLLLYKNGNLISQGILDSGNSFQNTDPIFFGHNFWASSTDIFNGNIDEIRIYNRNLSEGEILTMYKNIK